MSLYVRVSQSADLWRSFRTEIQNEERGVPPSITNEKKERRLEDSEDRTTYRMSKEKRVHLNLLSRAVRSFLDLTESQMAYLAAMEKKN